MQDINYDEVLYSGKITITLGGEQYEVEEPTIDTILAFEDERKKLTELSKNDFSISKVMPQIRKLITTVYKGIPPETLEKLSPRKLYKMLADVQGFINESMLPASADSQKPKNTPKKKLTTAN